MPKPNLKLFYINIYDIDNADFVTVILGSLATSPKLKMTQFFQNCSSLLEYIFPYFSQPVHFEVVIKLSSFGKDCSFCIPSVWHVFIVIYFYKRIQHAWAEIVIPRRLMLRLCSRRSVLFPNCDVGNMTLFHSCAFWSEQFFNIYDFSYFDKLTNVAYNYV